MCSPFGFSIQQFFICPFYCKKTTFVCEFQHITLWKIIFFPNVPHLLWIWDFVDMYQTCLKTRIWRGQFHIYLRKGFFCLQKFAVLLGHMEKTFSSTLNVMTLQTVKNECKIWYTCRHRSQLQDLMGRSAKRSPNFSQLTLL
jgi:hypothetical protein